MRVLADERGAGTVLAVAVIGTVATVAISMAAVLGVFVVRQRVAGAADAAALAAADVASGALPGASVCEAAAQVLAANGASLAECDVEGETVSVGAAIPWTTFLVAARSRAGPPAGPPSDPSTDTAPDQPTSDSR
ncbi:Rv3654c family TadE-like protein [Rathayibacter sp. YIM 133350]|uniref:Rv3654c family TadE-like protein n=1 Tax=Rathayibacter sp. YIM 133350 TaxID=3131992 RepID=UPI00307DD512